jgi:hypothetical protein
MNDYVNLSGRVNELAAQCDLAQRRQLEAVGTCEYSIRGELKVKFQDFFFECAGYVDPGILELKAGALTDGKGGPIYSTDNDTVELLGNLDVPFLKAMGNKAKLDKEIGTYYVAINSKGEAKGMLTCVQPSDHIIHHGLNHTSTVTSRLSASNPNVQNIPRGDKSTVKAMFVSRFGEHGTMGEIDYSQLEVVVMGLLSNDTNLVADLNRKVDFHCVRVAAREGCTYEEAAAVQKINEKGDMDVILGGTSIQRFESILGELGTEVTAIRRRRGGGGAASK